MSHPPFISAEFISSQTDYRELSKAIGAGFASGEILHPDRHHHDFPNPTLNGDSTMLIMPAWESGKMAGVKVVSINPNYHQLDKPSIQGAYLLLDATNGNFLATLDGAALTAVRTAATSALASSYLSRPDSSSLLMIGTGTLSPELIKAHTSVRPIEKVWIWGRDRDKASNVSESIGDRSFSVETVTDLKEIIPQADIVSCATSSSEPLIDGNLLRDGQHLDLVGSFKPSAREADDTVVKRSSIYLDALEPGVRESGDIVVPIQTGIIDIDDIRGDLFTLAAGRTTGRTSNEEITLFKSVGHSLEDLVGASYYYQKFNEDLSTN